MSDNHVLGGVLARRRDRSIAIILGVKERECDAHLPAGSSQKLRKVVLDQLNEFHDFCADILRSFDENSGIALNEVYLERLDAMRELLEGLAERG